jgi:hypothetical protein
MEPKKSTGQSGEMGSGLGCEHPEDRWLANEYNASLLRDRV